MLSRLLAAAETLSRWGVWFSGALLILAAFVVGVEVVARKAFNVSLGGADEVSGFAMAVGVAWSIAYTLLHRAHIRIDSLYVLLPRGVRIGLDLTGLVAFIAFIGLVALHGWTVFALSWEVGARTMSRMAAPLAVPQFLWVAGLFVFLAVAALLLLASFVALLRGDRAEVQRLIGSRSATEELDEELADARARRSPTRS